jgi:hypothetical protein
MDMGIDFDKLREVLENITQEEIDEFFPDDDKPIGWLSIEEYLPKMKVVDVMNGGTEYKVKFSNGTEGVSMVSDHCSWYFYAKEIGITHWFNE